MRIKPLSNRTIRESKRTIAKSNRTLVEEYSDNELNARSFVIFDAADEAIANITYPEIKNLIDKVGGRRSTVDKSSPCFVDRYGEVISVNDSVGSGGRAMHYDYAVEMVKEIYKKLGFMETELDKQCIEDGWVDTESLSDQLQSKMLEYGVFRINPGTNAVENRFYCVLPARGDYRLTDSQYDTLKDFLWLSEELGRHRIIVFFGDDGYDINNFHLRDGFGPDEILKEIKSYYGGFSVREELNEDTNCADIEKQKEQLEVSVYSIIEDYIGVKKIKSFGVKYNEDRNVFVIEIECVEDEKDNFKEIIEDAKFGMEELYGANYVGSSDSTMYFYIRANNNWDEKFSKEAIIKQALDFLEKGKVNKTDRGFILPNGDLVDNGYFGENGMPHWKVDTKLVNRLTLDNHLDWDDINDAFKVNVDRGILFADRIGCIRVNGYNEDYIALPESRPTSEQFYALEEWIDNFFSDTINGSIKVTTFDGKQQQTYDEETHTGRDVVNRIKRYYSSGTLYEALVMHWGDLDKGIKADKREIMPGRGTGHFGTGFYFVSKDQYGDMHTDYDPSRPIYVLDTSSYKLYKPLDNNTAYKLHDALKYINDCAKGEKTNFRFKQEDLEREFDDIEYEAYNSDEALEKSEEECNKDFRDAVIGFVKKYEPNVSDYYIERLSDMRPYDLEKEAKRFIKDIVNDDEKLSYAISEIADMFYVDEEDVEDLVINAYNTKSEDSISTLVMKGLGYEGIDVSHLQKSGQGVMGLDDFSYGTVVYDLKPNTYKRIAEPRGEKK